MAPVTFEKRKFVKEPKPQSSKRDAAPAKKTPALRRPTFNSFATEHGLINHDEPALTKSVNDLRDEGAELISKVKAITISAVAIVGVAVGLTALVAVRKKRSAPKRAGMIYKAEGRNAVKSKIRRQH